MTAFQPTQHWVLRKKIEENVRLYGLKQPRKAAEDFRNALAINPGEERLRQFLREAEEMA